MDYQDKSQKDLIIGLEALRQKYDELNAMYENERLEHSRLKDAFLHSENRYRDLVENMNDIIWEVDLDLKIKYISSGIEKVTGFYPSEMIGQYLFEFIEPRNVERLKNTFADRLESFKINHDLETSLFKHNQLCKNGEYKWLEALSNPVIDDKNRLLGFKGISRDISFQERADEKLKLSEDRLSKVFHSAPYVITILRVSDLKLIEVNLVAEEIFGFTREEILKNPSIASQIWVNHEQKDRYFDSIKALQTLKNFELQFRKKNGEIGTALMTTEYLTIDHELSVLASYEVITERKKAIDALRQSQANLLALVENTRDNIWAIDNNYQLIFLNEHFKKEFYIAYGTELFPGMNILDSLPNEIKYIWKSRYDRALANEHVEFVENLHLHISHIFVEVAMNPIVADGKIIGVSIFGHDITKSRQAEILVLEKNKKIEAQNAEYQRLNEDLKKLNKEFKIAKEKAEESDRLKTSFLQNMSHEIRTPMNAIMGFSSILAEQYNNKAKLEQYADIINQRCNDLLEIINDILDIAKIESGQLAVNIEPCDLNIMFLEIMSFFKEHQKRVAKERIEFSLLSLPNPEDNLILTDSGKLKQIFINLIGNAFKFTESGKIEVGCSVVTMPANTYAGTLKKFLKFYVKDTGIGIHTEKQKVIFARFVQLHQDQKKLYGGTGLGLSIVKGLVELLEGEIWLESEVACGTTFYFTIPYEPNVPLNEQSMNKNELQQFVFDGLKLLIVEDDIYNAQFLKEVLHNAGFNTNFTGFGKEAIQIAQKSDFDFVLMDIRLPDMDGYEVARHILSLKPNQKIIAQTAYAANDDKRKALEAGCIDYISKPIKQDLLLSIIQKHLTIGK
jgi:PAS domain S-box-containing protein